MKPWRLWLYEILAPIWQYETLTAMTVWNTVSHDSMKHLQPWQYETLNAGTVWSTDSMTILKSWQLWQYETSGVRWVRWALTKYYFQPNRGLRNLLLARLHIYESKWSPREVCSRVTTVRCTECVHHHDVRVFPTAHEWDTRLRTQLRIAITFFLSLLLT